MIVSKPAIVFHIAQIFFNFLAMCCFASVASFQAKWDVGPCTCLILITQRYSVPDQSNFLAGLTGFAVFISVMGIVLATFMLLVPVISEKYDKLNRLARGIQEVRVGFILTGTGTAISLLLACVAHTSFNIPFKRLNTIHHSVSSRPSPHGHKKAARTQTTIQMRTNVMTLRTD